MKKFRSLFGSIAVIVLFFSLTSSSCDPCESKADLTFAMEALEIIVEPINQSAYQVVRVVTPIINAYLDTECPQTTPPTNRTMEFYWKANPQDPYQLINVNHLGGGKSTNLDLNVQSLENGTTVTYQDSVSFNQNGIYKVAINVDEQNIVSERNEDNNIANKEGNSQKSLMFQVKGLPQKAGKPEVTYYGSRTLKK